MRLKDLKLNTLEWQQGKSGWFRQTAINKGEDEKWINNVLCFDWFYTFRYDNGKFFTLHIDTNGSLIKKQDHFFITK